MDGFLVVLRCQHDDLPIGLCQSLEEAVAICGDPPNAAICRQFRTMVQQDDAIAWHVVKFVDGEPVEMDPECVVSTEELWP